MCVCIYLELYRLIRFIIYSINIKHILQNYNEIHNYTKYLQIFGSNSFFSTEKKYKIFVGINNSLRVMKGRGFM